MERTAEGAQKHEAAAKDREAAWGLLAGGRHGRASVGG